MNGFRTVLFATLLALAAAAAPAAVALNSPLRAAERRDALEALERDRLEFLLLAPEQLANDETLARIAEAAPRLVVVDEAHPRCGFAADVVARVTQEAFGDLKASPKIVTAPHTPVPFSPVLEDAYVPTPATIADAVRATAAAAAGSAA